MQKYTFTIHRTIFSRVSLKKMTKRWDVEFFQRKYRLRLFFAFVTASSRTETSDISIFPRECSLMVRSKNITRSCARENGDLVHSDAALTVSWLLEGQVTEHTTLDDAIFGALSFGGTIESHRVSQRLPQWRWIGSKRLAGNRHVYVVHTLAHVPAHGIFE